jgi:hypothetical protein
MAEVPDIKILVDTTEVKAAVRKIKKAQVALSVLKREVAKLEVRLKRAQRHSRKSHG